MKRDIPIEVVPLSAPSCSERLFRLSSLDPPTREHSHATSLQISETGTLRQGLSANLTLVPSSVKDGRVVYSGALP